MNLNLLKTKQNENWTFWGSPFSKTISLDRFTYRPVAGPSAKNAKRTLEYYLQLALKFNLSTGSIFKLKKHFLYAMYTKNYLS